LFAQGRTRPGNIVTYAKGGESIHNHRMAFDIFKNIKGQEFNDTNFFKKAGKIWEEMGGTWGGSWVGFVDMPHMEYTGGLTIRDLQAGRTLPVGATMPWERVSQEVKEKIKQEIKIEEKPQEVEMRFNTVEQIPQWGQEAINHLIKKELLKGTGGGLDLSLDMLRLLVINYRAGIYDTTNA